MMTLSGFRVIWDEHLPPGAFAFSLVTRSVAANPATSFALLCRAIRDFIAEGEYPR